MVLVSVGSDDDARLLARTLVERKLVACAQIVPIQSYYEWQGKVEDDSEYLVLLKSRHEAYAELEAAIQAIHSYDVPEILALPIIAGHQPYLDWLNGIVAARSTSATE
jgi:periplasmic divalent cation tolerance protein